MPEKEEKAEEMRTVTVRLPKAMYDAVHRIAKKKDIPATRLVRGFIRDGIAFRNKEEN